MIFHGKNRGAFSQNRDSCDFFPEHKNREKRGNFTKSLIYRDQKFKKLPNDFFWMAVLSLLALFYDPCFQHETMYCFKICVYKLLIFVFVWVKNAIP